MILDDPSLIAELRRKLHEGLKAHSAATGIPLVGGAFEQAVLVRAEGELSGMNAAQVSAMSLTSERLVAVVAGSFDTILSTLSEPQRLALKAGFDPFSPAVQLAAGTPDGMARLLTGKSGVPFDTAGSEGRSGQRFAPLRDDGDRAGRSSFAGLDGETVTLFKTTGLNQGTFSDLIQRYSLAQIKQAAGLADEFGVGANAYAAKFAGLDGDSREDLRDFVADIRSEPGLSDDDKRRQISAFRAAHPKLGGLSDKDLFIIVNARQLKTVHDIGNDAARGLSTSDVLPSAGDRRAAHASQEARANAQKKAKKQTDAAVVTAMDDVFGVDAAKATPPRKPKQSGIPSGPVA